MLNKVKIAVDAIGGENSPRKIIEGIEIFRSHTIYLTIKKLGENLI